MRRFAESHLEQWITSKNRKVLLIRGARQVGKSTLVRNFAARQRLDLLEINLEQFPSPSIWQSMQGEKIVREIELAKEQRVTPKTLLFIDEIQSCPAALSALRYLYEEKPELPVVAAGSLLEFVMGEEDISIPVGRITSYHLGPMTFREVLLAQGKDILEESLHQTDFTNPSIAAHENLKEYYKEFLFTGGMPEAVKAAVSEKSPFASREIHRSIVSTYRDDFGKYKRRLSTEVVEQVFSHIPLHLGEKIKYVNISRHINSSVLKESIDALIKARIALPALHTACSGLPLKAAVDPRVFKLYFLDVGLCSYMAGVGWNELSDVDMALINKGNISEQFIAQHLAYREGGLEPPELYYWLREGRSTNAEVDFVTSHSGRIVPLEIKAGKSGSLRSLHQLMAKTDLPRAWRFDMNPPSKQMVRTSIRQREGSRDVSFELISLPAYMIETFLEVS